MRAIEKAVNDRRNDSRFRMLIHNIHKNTTIAIQILEASETYIS